MLKRPLEPDQKGACQVGSCRSPDTIAVSFDDKHLVTDAGLILAATLAEGLLLRELFDEGVDLGDAPGAPPTPGLAPRWRAP